MKKILLSTLFLWACFGTYASHIVGGEFYYKFITTYTNAGNTYQRYQIFYKVYRDSCSTCSQLQASYDFWIWRNSVAAPNTWTRYPTNNSCYTLTRTNGSDPARFIANNCFSTAHTIEEGLYTMMTGGNPSYLDLPNDSLDYYIGWGVNARSASINNIVTPANTGQASYTKIPKNNVYKNSNPVFLNRPISFFCVNKTQYINQNAFDPDGDSLSFSLVTPYNTSSMANPSCATAIISMPPNNVITWAGGGYSATAPLGAASTVSINSVTGELSITPGAVGFYIYAVAVREYRKVFGNWVLLCETRRDMQVQTGNCSTTNQAPQYAGVTPVKNADTSANQVVTAGDTICFKIKFVDPNGDSLFTSRQGPIFDNSQGVPAPYATLSQDTADSVVTSSFCWTTQCPHARPSSPYIFTFTVADNACNVTQKTFTILVNPKAVLNPPNLRCVDIVSNDSIRLTFTKPSYLKDFDKYYLYRRTGTTGSCTLIDSLTDTTVTSYIDTSIHNALTVSYGYTLRTRSTCNVYGAGCDTVNSIIVTGAKVLSHCTGLTWTPHRQNWQSLYKVYRIVGTTKTLVDVTRNTSYLKCDCNSSGKFEIEVDDSVVSCTSHSNYTASFTNIDTTAPKAVTITRATIPVWNQIQVDFPKSDSNDATLYIIWRSVNGGAFTPYDSFPSVTGNTTYSYIDNTSISSGRFCYKVQVRDSCGNRSALSADHCPVDLIGTAGNSVSKLNWGWRYNGYSFTSQIVQRMNTSGVWVDYATRSATDTFYDDVNVIPCRVYYYRIKTVNSADTTVKSYSDSVQVQPFDTIRPNTPNVRYISVTGAADVSLVFDTSASGDTKWYEIYGSVNGGSYNLIATLTYPAARPITYTWTPTNPQINTYSMYVKAVDSCGNNRSAASIAHTHVQLSGVPGNLRNSLTWTNYIGRTASTYSVQRYEVGNGTWSTIKTLNYPDTSFTDSSALKGCYPYVYRIVTAFAGFTFTSISDTLTLTPFDLIPPGPPVIKYASVVNNTTNKVVIQKSDSLDVNRYEIFFKSAVSGWRSAGIVYYPVGNPFTFIHTGLYTPDSNYSYYVKAIDSCGDNVSASTPVHTTIQLQSNAGAMRNFLNWSKYVGWLPNSYTVQRLIGGVWTSVKTLTSADSTWSDTTALKCNQPNSYRVYALNAANDTSYSDTTIVTPYDTIRPARPFLRYVSVENNTSVKIVCNTVTDPDVNRYEIWSATNNGVFSKITTIYYPTNPFTYTHTGLNTLANNYSYYVVALDSCSDNVSLGSVIHTTVQLSSTGGAMTNFLNWTKYVGWLPNNYYVQRLIAGTWTVVKVLNGTDSAWADTATLKCNQPNSYRVYGINAANDTTYSDTTIVTPYDTIRPARPFLRYVSVENNTSVKIVCNTVTDPDVNRYEIWSATNNGVFSKITTIYYPTNPFTYTHTGLNTLANNYSYYVVALDSCSDNVSIGSVIHTTVQLSSTGGAMTNFLNWTKYVGWLPNNYYVQRLIAGTWTVVKVLNGTDSAWADTAALKCNQPNSYRVYGINALNDTTFSDTTVVTPYDTIRPVAPFFRSVTVLDNTSVKITCNTAPDADINRYEIWTATNAGLFTKLTTIYYPGNPFTFVHTGLNTLVNNYSYYVVALDSCSDNVSLRSTEHTDIQLSSSPGNLTSKLSWTKYKGFTVGQYRVQRLIGATWTYIATLTGTDSTYNDTTNIGCNFTYAYRVVGINLSGADSSYSDTTMVTPFDTIKPDKPVIRYVTVATNNSVTITWQNSNPDVNKFLIYRKNGAGIYVKIDSVYYTNTYTDVNALPHAGSVCYAIKAVDSCAENTSVMSDPHCTVKLNLSYQKCPRGVILNWNNYTGWPLLMDKYEVYRSDNGGAETLIKTVTGVTTGFTDTGVVYSSTYCYRIKAYQKVVSGTGEVSWSDSSCFSTPEHKGPEIQYVSVLTTDSIVGNIEIKWNAQAFNNYVLKSRLYYSPTGLPGSYTLLYDNIPLSVNTYQHNNLNTRTQNHFYYMVSVDSCGRLTDSISLHRSINYTLVGGQLTNVMHWTPYIGWPVKYYILERKNSILPYADIDTLPGTDTAFMDFPAPCNIPLAYRIKAVSFNNWVSYSDTMMTVAIDTLPADQPITRNATVWANGINRINFITADSPDVFGYAIYRRQNNGNWFNIKFIQYGVPVVPYTWYDSTANTLLDYNQYVVVTLDSCLNATPSDTFHIIQLRGNPGERQSILRWHRFRGYGIDTFTVQKWDGVSFSNYATVANDTNFIDPAQPCNVPQYYRITARENSGIRTTLSDSIQIIPFDSIHPQPVQMDFTTVLNNNQLGLQWKLTDPDARDFIVQRKINSGLYTTLDTVFNYGTTYTDNVASTLTDTFSYRIIAYDTCSQNHSDTTYFHRAIQLKGIPENEQATLFWNAYTGFGNVRKYYVQKLIGGVWVLKDSVPGTITTYTDINQPCSQTQHYRVYTIDTNNVFNSYSDTIQLTPFDTIRPQKPVIRYASVVNNTDINVGIDKVPDVDVNRYEVYASVNSGPFNLITTVFNPATSPFVITHSGINTLADTVRYYVLAYDSCRNNVSPPSDTHRSIQLHGVGGAMTNFITWSLYQGYAVKNYHVQRLIAGNWTHVKQLASTDTAWADTANLACNFTYYYRVYSVNNADIDTAFSDTVAVSPYDTILPQSPMIRYVSVASPTSIYIEFNKVIDPDVNRYQIFESVNGWSYVPVGVVSAYSTPPYSFVRNGIDPVNTHYYYYVRAIDSCNNNYSWPGNVHGEVEIQGTPGNMQSILFWHPYKGFGVKNYEVQRLNGGVWTTIATIGNNDTNYIDASNISCNVNYFYRIRTVDLSSNGFVSLSDSVMVTPFDTVKPVAPLLKYVTVTSVNSVKVKWDLSASGDVKFYEVHRVGPGNTDIVAGTAVYADTLIDATVPVQSNSYCYYVIAVDSCNAANRSPASNTLCTMNLSASTGGCVPMGKLKWTRCQAFDELPVVNYEIFRSDNGGAWNKIKTVPATDTSYVDSAISLANEYCYVIRTFNSSATYASLSDTQCISTWIYPLRPAPILKVATVVNSGTAGSIALRWVPLPSTDTLARGYRIYHSSTGIPGSFTLLTDIPNIAVNAYNHVPVNNFTTDHYYFMVAYDVCNYNGDSSDTHHVVNLSVVNGNLSEQLSWNLYQGFNVQEYEVLKSYDGVNYFVLAKVNNSTTSYTDTMVSCNAMYWYRVRALENNSFFEVSYSDLDSVTAYDNIKPFPISMKQASVTAIDKVNGEITMEYYPNTERNRSGYKTYRSVNGGGYSLLSTSTNISTAMHVYQDQGLNTLDNIYSYYVTVLDSCGNEGLPSDTHTVVNVRVTAFNSANVVQWNHYQGFSSWRYLIQRYTSTNPVWTNVGGGYLSNNVKVWNDSDIICDTKYFYRIITFDDNDPTAVSFSDTSGCIGFETNPPMPPVILRVTVNKPAKANAEIQLDWIHSVSTDATYYNIYRRSSPSQPWQFITQTGYVNSYLDKKVNTLDSVYEYRLECVDNCRNTSTVSPDHATINLSTAPGNNRIFLNWNAYFGFTVDQYEIYRDGALVNSIPGTQINYTDTNLSCDTPHTYRIKALELNGNTQFSWSDTSTSTPYDIVPPLPVYSIYATVVQPENMVELKWTQMPEFDASYYGVYRSDGGSGWLRIYATKTPYETSYIDKNVNAGKTSYSYAIRPTDNCYNTGAFSNVSKTILLSGYSERLKNHLSWSNYEVWANSVASYDIYRADDDGVPFVVGTVAAGVNKFTDTFFTSSARRYCYYIQAHENPGGFSAVSNSNIICLAQQPVYWIPNVFSPGVSPGLNDFFKPYGLYFDTYEVQIFNRWGELLFKSTKEQPAWDGTFQGKPVPEDTYIYMIKVVGYDLKEHFEKGSVTIYR